MLGVATIPAYHDPKPYAPAGARQVRNLTNIPAVNASRRRSTQRTTRHLDTGPSGYKDGIVELRHAFDNQTHGDESRNPKIDWHGADSFWRTARCDQQTSSRLSQTQICKPIDIESGDAVQRRSRLGR